MWWQASISTVVLVVRLIERPEGDCIALYILVYL